MKITGNFSHPGVVRWRLARALRKRWTALLALSILVVFSVAAGAGNLLIPYPPNQQNMASRLLSPRGLARDNDAPPHVLGTDYLGRDVLSRIIVGARVSLVVAAASVSLAGLVGLAIGMLSGYLGGVLDELFGLVSSVQLGFPFILLAIILAAFARPGLGSIILVLVITTWVIFGRLVRAATLSVKAQDHIEAARALGASTYRILLKHVLPNVASSFLVISTLEAARIVILESTLSFLGMGVPPPTPTWGGMLAEGRTYMLTAWWLTVFPGVAILTLVLSVNVLGDFLRDYFDPRLKI